jgi:NAD(P)H-quinone oxidoreductase subunit 4
MSGFVAELMVFVGFATSDAYNPIFRTIVVILMGVGVILTPIYLLSMLREILYGPENKELTSHHALIDAEPREVFIIACLLVPIIGIGFYPKVAMQMYDAKTVAINAHVRQSYTIISQTNPRVYASGFFPGQIPATELTPVLGTLK